MSPLTNPAADAMERGDARLAHVAGEAARTGLLLPPSPHIALSARGTVCGVSSFQIEAGFGPTDRNLYKGSANPCSGIGPQAPEAVRPSGIDLANQRAGTGHEQSPVVAPVRQIAAELHLELPIHHHRTEFQIRGATRGSTAHPQARSGFHPEQASQKEGHLGVIGMRERVESLGGQFEIMSEIGQGTRITTHLPLQMEGGLDE